METVFHIDVNSAYLSWTAADRVLNQNDEIDLRDIPSIIGGDQKSRHGIVLAKSVPAKKYRIETGEPLVSAIKKCPDLTIVPPDYGLYVSASLAFLRLLQKYCPRIEQYSIDEYWVYMTGTERLFGTPVLFAEYLKQEIFQQLGFTVNIGVSSNKLLAKMASEFEKPNQVHTLYPNEIEKKMWPLPVRELFFVGPATERKLFSLGIRTIGEIANTKPELLKLHLKKHGEIIHSFARGDSSYLDWLITQQQKENKGYGNSMTLPYDSCDSQQLEQAILSLCETLGCRLRGDGVKVKTIAVSMTRWDFTRLSRQCQLYSETDITQELYQSAKRVLHEVWDSGYIRQIGVHTGKVTTTDARQYNLFDLDRFDLQRKLDSAIGEIRERYGKDAVFRACFLNHASLKHMSGGIDDVKLTGMTKPMYHSLSE